MAPWALGKPTRRETCIIFAPTGKQRSRSSYGAEGCECVKSFVDGWMCECAGHVRGRFLLTRRRTPGSPGQKKPLATTAARARPSGITNYYICVCSASNSSGLAARGTARPYAKPMTRPRCQTVPDSATKAVFPLTWIWSCLGVREARIASCFERPGPTAHPFGGRSRSLSCIQ